MGVDTVHTIAKQWFHYPVNKVSTRTKDLKVNALNLIPILTGCLNALFVIGFLFFAMLKGFRNNRQLTKLLGLTACFWIVNFGFSVFAAPVSLRLQVFPVLVILAATLPMIEHICIAAFKPGALDHGIFNQPGLSVSH
jgi:hypothetical protein